MMNFEDEILIGRAIAKSLRSHMVLLPWLICSAVFLKFGLVESDVFIKIFLSLIWLIAIYGILAIHNDLSDSETDKINRRSDIPFASGDIHKNMLMKVLFVLSIIVILFCFFFGFKASLVIFLYLLLGWLYSGCFKLKNHGFIASLVLGACYGFIPWLLGLSISDANVNTAILTIACSNLIFSSGTVIIKDYKDTKGDKATGKKTILVMKGARFTMGYSLVMTTAAYIIVSIFCMLSNNFLMAILGLAIAFINYSLLSNKMIFTKEKTRAYNSTMARYIFYFYCISVMFLMIPAA